MNQTNGHTAAGWREKAQEARAATAEPVELPSGFVAMLAPPPLELWWGSEKMPQTLTADVQRVFGETEGVPDRIEEAFAEIGEERAGKVLVFMRDVVQATCVKPCIVVSDPNEDEMAASEVPMKDFAAIFAWGMAQTDKRMVKTRGGAVSVGALRSFRHGQGKSKSARPRKSRRKVPQASK